MKNNLLVALCVLSLSACGDGSSSSGSSTTSSIIQSNLTGNVSVLYSFPITSTSSANQPDLGIVSDAQGPPRLGNVH
ncbi:MAG TPA: hypothetical protein PLQ34_03110, partial [Ferrovaceae bacterium]|nr:hypothetical protein [Ferrovaceae bacterium]